LVVNPPPRDIIGPLSHGRPNAVANTTTQPNDDGGGGDEDEDEDEAGQQRWHTSA